MNYAVDTESGTIAYERDGRSATVPLYSPEGFELLSQLWLKVGWDQKYTYTFTWMDRPVVQLPEDLLRIGEVVHRVQPDVIVECGVAHGGSLVYYASLCELIGNGRVVGVDVEIRPHNRTAIEQHPMSRLITLIEGSSTDRDTLARVAEETRSAGAVLVVLDSDHSREHVLAELEGYSQFVTVGSYIIAMDGIMALVADAPRGDPTWVDDNPISAVEEFASIHDEFTIEQPEWAFNESPLSSNVTYAPRGYLRRNR